MARSREPLVPREELAATLEARRELGEALEPELLDSFVERIESRLDERLRARRPAPREKQYELALALGSIVSSIPLIAIAGGIAGLPGITVVCAALVLVNVLFRS